MTARKATINCQFCNELFTPQGIQAHEKSCSKQRQPNGTAVRRKVLMLPSGIGVGVLLTADENGYELVELVRL